MTVLDTRAANPAADLAAENAELRRRLDEALAREQAAADILGIIKDSPGDLAPVFDTILDKALHLCGGAFGVCAAYEGDQYRIVASRGLPPALAEFVKNPVRIDPGSMPDRLRRGEDTVQIADIAAVEPERRTPGLVAMTELGQARTALWVGLRKDDVTQGFVGVYRQEVRPFTDAQIALLQNFAAQAVIAMENARLITETREALEQQTATAEVLGVINSSPGDLQPVFDAILEKAHTLCGVEMGSLQLFDGEVFRAVSQRGNLPPFAERLRQGARAGDNPAIEPLVFSGDFVHIPDMAELDHPVAKWAAQLNKTGTLLSVPLRRGGQLLGVIIAARREVRLFTDKQIALLQNFAAQAVIAMENARLLTETREALEQQTATAEVLGVINSSPGDLTPVFDAMLEKALHLCEASLGTLYNCDGELFHCVGHRGVSTALADFLREPIRPRPQSSGSFHRLLLGATVIHDPDIRDSEAYRDGFRLRRALVDLDGARTGLWVALRKEESLLGTFVIYRREVRPFTDKQIALLENFAAQAVIAMENARLITETREALEQQTATAEVLGVISSSPGDLIPVFDAMLEKALRLCGAVFGSLATYDGELFHSLAFRGMPRPLVEVLSEPYRPIPGSFLFRLVNGEPFGQAADLAALPPNDDAHRRGLVDLGGARSTLWMALRKEDALLGMIAIYRQEVRQFSEKETALLQNFAAQAVIAMENARLLGELRQRTDEVAELNRGLEARVADQVEELGRVGKLKRFLAPQLAELIVSQGDENILESHRREIVVVFCDLRGFTAFAETAEPEEVLELLREYHAALGPLVGEFEGTLDHFSGDGIMVFFNDPVPCPDPAERAVKMAVAMRDAANGLITAWRRRGRELGFGVGIAQGYATLGQIGFADRSDYTAIGTVCNLAARLCGEAKDGQILLSRRVAAAVEETVAVEEIGTLSLKGLAQPVAAFNVRAAGSTSAAGEV